MMLRLVREDRSLRFWRVLIFDPPTRRRRCNLSTFSVAPYAADYGTAVRAVAGRDRNRILCQLPDLYAYTTPHSLRSYGVCSVARSLSRYRFVANSFRQAAPKPTYAPTALCCGPLAPFSTASKRYTNIAFFPTLRCTRIIHLRLFISRLAAERIYRIDAHSLH